MRNRGRRGRSKHSTDDWVEKMEGLISSKAAPGYRLSAMLVQRARLGTDWNASWDAEVEKLRDSCAEGVHPVWPRLGKESPLLAEMAIYPETVISNEKSSDTSEWVSAARFDPQIRSSLAAWLESTIPFSLSAEIDLSIQRLAKSLRAKGKMPKMPASLDELEGDAVIIRALARICIGEDELECMEDLELLLTGEDALSLVAADHLSLFKLRSGNAEAWADCYAVEGHDELANAMRQQAWIDAPDDAEMDAAELQQGIALLDDGDSRRALMWSLVGAQIREGDLSTALENVSSLNLIDSRRLPLVLKLIHESGNDALIQQLTENIHRLENDGLLIIMKSLDAPLALRSDAAIQMQERGGLIDEELEAIALDIFTENGDANRIGSILMSMDDGAITHPHRTILVYHLLPGNANLELHDWVLKSRVSAIEVLANEPSGVLSDTSIELVKLLEGAPAELNSIRSLIGGNQKAFHSFKQTIRALGPGGDGLVPADRIDSLQTSINNSSMSGVELRLFCAVLDQLRFNQAIRLLDDHREQSTNSAISILDNMVGKEPRKQIIDDIRQIVLEHDSIAIPAFAEWHRLNAASSSWHQIILASIEEMRGNYLSAGRSLRRASQDVEFSFENRVRLARRALISFAHAGRFGEAVEMLESQQALQSALTGLFQLYLHVCDDVKRDQTDAARRRLMDWIRHTETFSEEDEEGEIVIKERTMYPSDELDLLFTYPNTRNLPKEPWQGRIRSTKRRLSHKRRSQRSQLEDRFQHILDDKASVQEIEAVSGEAAALNPTQGLMMIERAMNSGQFSNHEMKALLRSQNAIFRLNEKNLPIKVRRKLRHLTLSPLIIVDTNLLIDTAMERIGWLLDEDGGIDTRAFGSFHRTVLHKANEGVVELMVPKAAEKEFRGMMGNLGRVRSLFGHVWLNEIEWVERVTEDAVASICKDVLSDFSTWKAPADDDHETLLSTFEEKTVEFMLRHRDTYFEVVDSKAAHSASALEKRTEISGDMIYPERGDRDIMREAAAIASSTHKGIGAVLVASRDSDFWIVRRSLEETFGYGVVRTARELSYYA